MTREIKFRGKRLDNGKWVYGSLIIRHGAYYIAVSMFDLVKQDCEYPVAPTTVGQYTGLKDRNGREIYEGDILQAGHFGEGTDVVVWDNENARYIGRSPQGCISYVGREPSVTLLGNIHDNPELLNTK